VHKHNRRITRITAVLIVKLEREPTAAELADALGIAVSELASLQHLSQPRQLVSFEESSDHGHGEESLPLMERLADSSTPTPDQAVHRDEDRRMLRKCLAALPKSQATVINQHYLQDIPLRDVADRLKVTPSRVSQLHHQALGRLRQSWNRAEARI
jgi:RNA polymerase sigma factor for flagellar operon FliA